MDLADLISNDQLAKYNISADMMTRAERLADYDLSFLTNNFTEAHLREFSPEQLFPLIRHFSKFNMQVTIDVTRNLEIEFRKFVLLTLIRPDRRNAPSGPVDMYWHFFVLHTPEYIGFCTAIFGAAGPQPRLGKHYFQDVADKRVAMVDHIPATDETRPAMWEAYNQTRALYAEIYGEPDIRFWPAPVGDKQTTCGDSYSGFVAPFFRKEGAPLSE